MTSSKNNNTLHAALQRRHNKMEPKKGWEERLLSKVVKEQSRSQHILRIWIPSAVAAAAALLFTFPVLHNIEKPIKTKLPLVALTHNTEESIPDVVTTEKTKIKVLQDSSTPKTRQAPEVIIVLDEFEAELDGSITVEEELAGIFSNAEDDIEWVNAFSASFDDLNPIIISTALIELQ